MKEQFRKWSLRDVLRVKYTDGANVKRVWEKNQQELLQEVLAIAEDYMGQGITLTNRQLYYQLVTKNIIPNADEIYKRICTFITDARYAGYMDWEAIEDRGRVPSKPSEWDNISDLIKSAVRAYRLPRWENQNYYIELYCEKQAMESVLKPVADKYHIYFGVNKGYSSASTMYDLAQRVKSQIQRGKRVILLYLGDHDPSGLDMVRDIQDRITEFLTRGNDPIDNEDDDIQDIFRVEQLALNMEQIRRYAPPPNPAKITDPRAKWYIQKYGNKSWELDALEPKVLIRLATEGILCYLDEEKYEEYVDREKREKQALIEFGKTL